VEITTLLLPLGIIPSLFILYFIVGGYEGKFEEKIILIAFIIGMAVGTILYLIEGMILYSQMLKYIDAIIIFSLLFSVQEQLAKVAILNTRFFEKKGLPIYGAGVGLGMASTFSPLLLGASFEISLENFLPLLLPFSAIFLGCATGIFIGIGIKRGDKFKFFFYAVLSGSAFWIFTSLSFYHSFFPILAIISSLFAFYIAYRNLPFGMLERRELLGLSNK